MKALTIVLNQMSNRSYLPSMWKFAVTVPLLKPGKEAKDLTSYRPISLVSNVSKIWEKVIAAKLEQWMDDNNLIQKLQFGFVKGLSSTHALSSLGSFITKSLQRKKPIIAVALDIQKAYDTVAPGLLVEKLANSGFDAHWT